MSGVISVFVSSTFRDFHVERDILNGPVRERLNELLEPLGARVEIVDLRWGVDTAQLSDEERHNRVLEVCLGEIDRCRPLFVGMLGDRLGWRPPADRLRRVAATAGMSLSGDTMSVTALEFERALAAGDTDPVFFKRTIGGRVPPGWVDEDPAPLRRLEARVPAHALHPYRATCDGERVKDAGGFEDLAYGVLAARVADVARARRQGEADPYAAAEDLHLSELRRGFVDPWGVVDQVVGLVERGERVCLDGPPGSGKSAVWTAAIDRLRAGGRRVVTHAAGVGGGFHSHDDVIRRLIGELGGEPPEVEPYRRRDAAVAKMMQAAHGIERPTQVGGEALLRAWAGTLESAPTTVVAIDGLDRLEPGGARTRLDLLRDVGGTPCVVTTTDPDDVRRLAVRGFHRVSVPALNGEHAVSVIDAMTAAGHRQLSATATRMLAARQNGPLWLRLALDEFNALGEQDFRQADEAGEDALETLLQGTVAALPKDIVDLAQRVRLRAQQRFGQDEVLRLLGVLCASRYGVRRADLKPAVQADDVTVAGIVRMLSPIVTSGIAGGRVAFRTSIVRDAVAARLGELVGEAREWLAGHIGEIGDAGGHTDALEFLVQALELGEAEALPDVLRILNRASRHRVDAVALAASIIRAQSEATALRALLAAIADERPARRRAVAGEVMSLGRDKAPVRDFAADLLAADALPRSVRDELERATGDAGAAETLRQLTAAGGPEERSDARETTRRLLAELRDSAYGTKFPAPVIDLAEGLLRGAAVSRRLEDRGDEAARLREALEAARALPEDPTDQSRKLFEQRALDGLASATLRDGDLQAAAELLDEAIPLARDAVSEWPAERRAYVGYLLRLRGKTKRMEVESVIATEAAQLATLRRTRASALRRRILVALRRGERDTVASLAEEFVAASYATVRSGAPNATELEARCDELSALAELAADSGDLGLAAEAISILVDERYLSERGPARRAGIVYAYARRGLLREHRGAIDAAIPDYVSARRWSGGDSAGELDARAAAGLLVALLREERSGAGADDGAFEDLVLSGATDDGTPYELLGNAIAELEADAAGGHWSRRYSAETLLETRRCLHGAFPSSAEAAGALVAILRAHAREADTPEDRVATLAEACDVAESVAADGTDGSRHHAVARVRSLLATAHVDRGDDEAAADCFDRMLVAAERAAESLGDPVAAVRYRLGGIAAAAAQAAPGPRADALREQLVRLRAREAELVAEAA